MKEEEIIYLPSRIHEEDEPVHVEFTESDWEELTNINSDMTLCERMKEEDRLFFEDLAKADEQVKVDTQKRVEEFTKNFHIEFVRLTLWERINQKLNQKLN